MSGGSPYDRALDGLERRGKAPWQRRHADFMRGSVRRGRIEIAEGFGRTAEKLSAVLDGLSGTAATVWDMPDREGMRLAVSTVHDVFEPDVPHLLALAPDGAVVGVFSGGDLYVDPAFRGQGIGAELMLARAVLHDGGAREGLLYSAAGHAAAVAAHRLAVSRALAEGKDVRPEVVSDYPSLAGPPGVRIP